MYRSWPGQLVKGFNSADPKTHLRYSQCGRPFKGIRSRKLQHRNPFGFVCVCAMPYTSGTEKNGGHCVRYRCLKFYDFTLFFSWKVGTDAEKISYAYTKFSDMFLGLNCFLVCMNNSIKRKQKYHWLTKDQVVEWRNVSKSYMFSQTKSDFYKK